SVGSCYLSMLAAILGGFHRSAAEWFLNSRLFIVHIGVAVYLVTNVLSSFSFYRWGSSWDLTCHSSRWVGFLNLLLPRKALSRAPLPRSRNQPLPAWKDRTAAHRAGAPQPNLVKSPPLLHQLLHHRYWNRRSRSKRISFGLDCRIVVGSFKVW